MQRQDSDVLSVAASHALNLRPVLADDADSLTSRQTKDQRVMLECSTAAALNALEAGIQAAFLVKSWILHPVLVLVVLDSVIEPYSSF